MVEPDKKFKNKNKKKVRFNLPNDTSEEKVPSLGVKGISKPTKNKRCWNVAPEDPKNPFKLVLNPNASKLLQRRRHRKKEQDKKARADSVEGDGTLPLA